MVGYSEHSNEHLRFEVLISVTMYMLVFWAATPWGFAGRYKRLEGTYYLHFQGLSDLKMEAVFFSETLSTYKSTRRYSPEEQY
jgi:hypothetical protein